MVASPALTPPHHVRKPRTHLALSQTPKEKNANYSELLSDWLTVWDFLVVPQIQKQISFVKFGTIF